MILAEKSRPEIRFVPSGRFKGAIKSAQRTFL